MSPSLARFFTGTLVLSLFLLPACSSNSPREGVTPAQAHMYAHFDRAGELHDAIMKGRLSQAKDAARWIASHQERQGFSGRSVYFQDAMQAFASEVDRATTLKDAANAAARMGQACGDCHREHEVQPRFLIGSVPPSGSGPQAEMVRHVWGEERMWEGLVGSGDQAWQSGAEAIQSGWLNTQEIVSSPHDRTAIRDLVMQVYELAGEATHAHDSNDRARIFGEFLYACAECHSLTEAKIGEW